MLQSLSQLYLDSFKGLTRDIWVLSIIAFINRSGTVVFFLLSVYLSVELGFSKTQISIVMASHGAGSVAGGYIGGWLTDRIGYYRVMFWSLMLVSILFFSLAFIESYSAFCLMGFLTSVVGDAFRPAGMASITAYGGIELQTRSMSLYRLAINFGFGAGMAIAGFLAGMYGYRVLFFMDGGTCILAGILFMFFLKEKKETPAHVEDKEPIKIAQHSAYKDAWYMMFVFFLLLNSIVFLQLVYTYPLFCTEVLKMKEGELGAFMSFNGILIGVLEMPLIYVLAKKRDQMGYITWGVVLIGLSYLVFNFFGFTIIVAIISMLLISVGEIINFPLASSLALHRSSSHNRGEYMGLYSMLFSIGGIIAPLIGLKIAEDYGYEELWNLMGVLCAISTIGLLFLRKNYQPSLAQAMS